MSVVICGSLAFDTIMQFEGEFSQQILPESLSQLSVSFLVPTLRREYGGCAGNIAYSLRLLGGDPIVVAALGHDGGDYLSRLSSWGVSTSAVQMQAQAHTAQAMIMTDSKNNQITAFHPGAMSHAHHIAVTPQPGLSLGIISPDGRDAMLTHADQMREHGIRFVFDPGQGLPMFDGSDLQSFIDKATWVTVNEYEAAMLCQRTEWTLAEISTRVDGLVVTQGDAGCDVWQNGVKHHVVGVKATSVIDPTGCGDAFRGGLLYGLEQGWSLVKSCQLGNAVGAIKIAHQGGQNHEFAAAELIASL